MVAVHDEALPELEEIAGYLTSNWPDTPPLSNVSRKGNVVTFNWGEAVASLTLFPMPMPWQHLEGPCAAAWYWPEATTVMRGHPRHVLVTLIDEGRDPIEKSLRLTRLVAAVAACCDANGIFWGPGRMVHPPDEFLEVSREMTREHLPLFLWIDFRLEQIGPQAYRLYTTGLEPLGQREIEVERYDGDPQTIVAAVYNVAHYALEQQKPLRHGDTIGAGEGERIASVHHDSSMLDPDQSVIRLEF